IVVDDGSTDETPEVLAAYGDRIRVLRKPNGGVASARNAGVAAARGDFLAFLDDDDRWRPEKLARQMARLAETPARGLVYTDCARFDEHGPLGDPGRVAREGWVFGAFVERYFIVMSTVLVRAEVARAAGPFDEDYRRQDDLDFLLRVLDQVPVAYVDEKLVERRKYARPITPEDLIRSATEQEIYVEKTVRRFGASGKLPRRWAERNLARAALKRARAAEMLGDVEGAAKWYRAALSRDPWKARAWRRWLLSRRRSRASLVAAGRT
ncbi:MAG: glycosyltransferase, partial [Myxococcales bacterium]|nr:glycosyltransferase [Myxococcales bacterium]